MLPLGNVSAPRPQLVRPKDRTKDQTYYLSSIPEASLARTLFPLALYLKTEVREMAKRWNLPTATREESMGICFVGEKRRFDSFICAWSHLILSMRVTDCVFQHSTFRPDLAVSWNWVPAVCWGRTTGCGSIRSGRMRASEAWRSGCSSRRRTWTRMRSLSCLGGELPVRRRWDLIPILRSDHPGLYTKGIVSRDWQWIWADAPPPGLDSSQGFNARVQFRHRMADVPCTVYRYAVYAPFVYLVVDLWVQRRTYRESARSIR